MAEILGTPEIPGTKPDPLKDETPKTSASADIGGVEVPASHTPETYALIKQARQELADWNVKWGAKPQTDSRSTESAHFWREKNDELIKPYKAKERYVDEKGRIRNLMHVAEFCRKLDRILGPAHDGGSRIFINHPPKHPAIDEHMKGLFIKMRGMDQFIYHTDLPPGWKKVCSIQVPYMSEWGIMNLDERGCFKSWKYIGWRGQVLLRLILAGAITEEEAHQEFGVPQGTEIDREYHRLLKEHANGKRTDN